MPKTPTDYSKTVIYKIQHIDKEDLLYVGSTTDFTQRKTQHKHKCKSGTAKLYQMIRDNGGWNEFNMVVIKKFCCENGQEAKAEEDRIIRQMKCNMNMRRAYTTNEEKKEYYEQNKERLNEQSKQYYERNKEQKKEYYENNKEKIKQYYEQNKEQIKERRKEYYEQNIEKIKQYQEEQIICVCGCPVRKVNLPRHRRTMKHRNILIENGINPDELIY
jgi:hypothetical protein